MKIMIRMSFLGRNFYGTQRLKKDRTIQGEFERLLSKIYCQDVKVMISSRLDRFVNALDFAITYTPVDDRISFCGLSVFLTSQLSPEVVIKDIRYVDDDFSCRHHCNHKTYCYLIQNKKPMNPLLSSLSFMPKQLLDTEKAKEALNLFLGTHDFVRFSTPEGDENTTLTIDKVSLKEKDGMIYLRFQGKNFLRYQVRFMVGSVIRYAQGKMTLKQIQRLLEGFDPDYPRYKAEPQGLFLERISYPKEIEEGYAPSVPSVFFDENPFNS